MRNYFNFLMATEKVCKKTHSIAPDAHPSGRNLTKCRTHYFDVGLIAVLVFCSSGAKIAHGDDTAHTHPYTFDRAREWTLVGAGLGLAGVGMYYDARKTPYNRSDDARAQQTTVPRFERTIAGNWDTRAAQQSDLWLAASIVTPLTFLLPRTEDAEAIITLYGETAVLLIGGIAFSKGLVDRNRPYTYAQGAPDNVRYTTDTKRSFFSGHAATITGWSVFSATLFGDYFPDSPYSPWVWAGALGIATYASGLRVVAGMHFPSDVLSGMAYGATIGYMVPTLHKKYARTPITFYMDRDQFGLAWQSTLK